MEKKIVEQSIKDNVKVTTYSDGTQSFEPINDSKATDNRSWLQKIIDWFSASKVKPYVKVRDLADPFGDRDDPDAGQDGKTGIEAGIKISF